MVGAPSMQLQTELVRLLIQPVAGMSKVGPLRILARIRACHVSRAAMRQVELVADR